MNARFTATCTALTLASLAVQPSALAGDREWAVAGKVLTGIAAAHVISRAIEPRPVVVYPSPAPTVVYQSPPPTVVYQSAPAPTTYTYAQVAAAPVAPAAPVYATTQVYAQPAAPTTAVVYQTAPQVVYVAAPPVVWTHPAPVVVYPYGHAFRPRRCFPRW